MRQRFALIRHSIQATVFYLAPRLSTVILFILVSWHFGPKDAGIYTLGVTFLLILNVVTRGIDDLIVRECAQPSQDATHLFVRFGLLRLLLVLFFYVLLLISIKVGFRYGSEASNFIILMALVAFPEAIIATCQSIFVGLQNFKKPSQVIGATNFIKLVLGAAVILSTGTLALLAWSAVASYVAGAIFMLTSLRSHLNVVSQKCPIPYLQKLRRNKAFLDKVRWIGSRWPTRSKFTQDLRQSLPFMAITGLVGTEGQLDIILLSIFQSEQAVGWYGAATTITSSFAILSQAYRQSVYPVMSQYVANVLRPNIQSTQIRSDISSNSTILPSDLGKPVRENISSDVYLKKLNHLYESSILYLGLLSFPIAAGTILIAPTIVPALFGNAFGPTITIVQILAIGIPFGFLNVPNSRLMFAYNAQRYLLLFVAIAFVLNIGLNFLLTPFLSSNGAALARVISMVVLCLSSHSYVRYTILHRSVWKQIIAPLIASGIMITVLLPLRSAGLFVVFVAGVLVYGLVIWLMRAVPREDLRGLYDAFARKFTWHRN